MKNPENNTENSKANRDHISVIQADSSWWSLDLAELRQYKDLFFFLVWRDIKVLYAQTILGFSWAIIQPLLEILIFTIIFGRVARIGTEGIPYVLFSSVAIIPWNYMSQAMTKSSESLILGQNMLGKIYFPRLIYPLTPVLAKLLDFGISMIIVVAIMIYYRVWPTWNLLLLPVFVLVMILVASGVGFWLSAMAIRFRDVKHAMPFAIRMMMYSAPIVYSASSIPEKYRIFYSLNPIVCVIEGFRSCLLGLPFSWNYILPGAAAALVLFIGGFMYFNRMESIFVDVI
ncbi:ABC transporter permease [Desulfococcus sp.]|uniref:ABC transporter permease n=1 Tax=Desulfococcus sp. TaxID=2025834 RepID=UPI0035946727